ncbi:hypothetical protein HK405_009542, partial [Cladochytrium tenue]
MSSPSHVVRPLGSPLAVRTRTTSRPGSGPLRVFRDPMPVARPSRRAEVSAAREDDPARAVWANKENLPVRTVPRREEADRDATVAARPAASPTPTRRREVSATESGRHHGRSGRRRSRTRSPASAASSFPSRGAYAKKRRPLAVAPALSPVAEGGSEEDLSEVSKRRSLVWIMQQRKRREAELSRADGDDQAGEVEDDAGMVRPSSPKRQRLVAAAAVDRQAVSEPFAIEDEPKLAPLKEPIKNEILAGLDMASDPFTSPGKSASERSGRSHEKAFISTWDNLSISNDPVEEFPASGALPVGHSQPTVSVKETSTALFETRSPVDVRAAPTISVDPVTDSKVPPLSHGRTKSASPRAAAPITVKVQPVVQSSLTPAAESLAEEGHRKSPPLLGRAGPESSEADYYAPGIPTFSPVVVSPVAPVDEKIEGAGEPSELAKGVGELSELAQGTGIGGDEHDDQGPDDGGNTGTKDGNDNEVTHGQDENGAAGGADGREATASGGDHNEEAEDSHHADNVKDAIDTEVTRGQDKNIPTGGEDGREAIASFGENSYHADGDEGVTEEDHRAASDAQPAATSIDPPSAAPAPVEPKETVSVDASTPRPSRRRRGRRHSNTAAAATVTPTGQPPLRAKKPGPAPPLLPEPEIDELCLPASMSSSSPWPPRRHNSGSKVAALPGRRWRSPQQQRRRGAVGVGGGGGGLA